MSNGIIILSTRKVNQFHLKYNKSQLIIESGLSSAVGTGLGPFRQSLPITSHIRLMTYTAQRAGRLTNCSLPSDWLWSNKSIWKISQQAQDLQNWEEVSTKPSEKRNLSNMSACRWINNLTPRRPTRLRETANNKQYYEEAGGIIWGGNKALEVQSAGAACAELMLRSVAKQTISRFQERFVPSPNGWRDVSPQLKSAHGWSCFLKCSVKGFSIKK